jgi:hypothetical protein
MKIGNVNTVVINHEVVQELQQQCHFERSEKSHVSKIDENRDFSPQGVLWTVAALLRNDQLVGSQTDTWFVSAMCINPKIEN